MKVLFIYYSKVYHLMKNNNNIKLIIKWYVLYIIITTNTKFEIGGLASIRKIVGIPNIMDLPIKEMKVSNKKADNLNLSLLI